MDTRSSQPRSSANKTDNPSEKTSKKDRLPNSSDSNPERPSRRASNSPSAPRREARNPSCSNQQQQQSSATSSSHRDYSYRSAKRSRSRSRSLSPPPPPPPFTHSRTKPSAYTSRSPTTTTNGSEPLGPTALAATTPPQNTSSINENSLVLTLNSTSSNIIAPTPLSFSRHIRRPIVYGEKATRLQTEANKAYDFPSRGKSTVLAAISFILQAYSLEREMEALLPTLAQPSPVNIGELSANPKARDALAAILAIYTATHNKLLVCTEGFMANNAADPLARMYLIFGLKLQALIQYRWAYMGIHKPQEGLVLSLFSTLLQNAKTTTAGGVDVIQIKTTDFMDLRAKVKQYISEVDSFTRAKQLWAQSETLVQREDFRKPCLRYGPLELASCPTVYEEYLEYFLERNDRESPTSGTSISGIRSSSQRT